VENPDADIRGQKGLDGLGVLGDLSYYSVRAALWAKDYVMPQSVRAHAFPKCASAPGSAACARVER